ncbi:MAG TPA: hypothetical protein VK879_22535 [Candidatus Sulfomarinibacteraceae bacterium]|nr:hypothetical protein [Candidatus Sulfomarinibacteraceae bacterium]
MRRRTLLTVCLLLLAVAAVTLFLAADRSVAQADPHAATATHCSSSYCLDWDVLGGGVGDMRSDSYLLRATLGQTVAGLFSGDAYELHAGYWAGIDIDWEVYLPLLTRDS